MRAVAWDDEGVGLFLVVVPSKKLQIMSRKDLGNLEDVTNQRCRCLILCAYQPINAF